MNKRNLWGGLATIIVGGAVITGAVFAGQQLRAVIPQPATSSAVVVHEESRVLVGTAVHPAPVIVAALVAPPVVEAVPPVDAGWTEGQAPAGTPIPTHLDEDPNSGSYGQYIIMDPGFFCASHSGNDTGGVQYCA